MSVQLVVDGADGAKLIGTRGVVVASLEEGTGARISVDREGNHKAVGVTGDAAAKRICYERILTKLEEFGTDVRAVSILIPVASITAIVGKAGSTVKGIEGETGAKIDLPRRGCTESPAKVKLSGNPAEVVSAMLEIERILQTYAGVSDFRPDAAPRFEERLETRRRSVDGEKLSLPHVGVSMIESTKRPAAHQGSVSFLINGSLARALVGQKGAVVHEIERQTGSRVSITQDTADNNRIVNIFGGKRSVALTMALEKMEEAVHEPIASVHFLIPAGTGRHVIGVQGVTVQAIERNTCAKVDVARDGGEEMVVTICGAIPQIVPASELVYEAIAGVEIARLAAGGAPLKRPVAEDGVVSAPQHRRIISAPPREFNSQRKEFTSSLISAHRRVGGPHIELLVNGRMASKIVGAGGASVKMICDETGANVDVERGNNLQKSVTITSESIASRKRATEMILERLAEVGDGPVADALLRVPERLVTILVGPSGARVMEMEKETNTKINIANPRSTRQAGTPGSVQIKGALVDIMDVIMRIDAIVNKDT